MRLTVNGVAYHVEKQGSGPAVLFLLHGFTGSSATWTPHLVALQAFTTVRVDFLGHGRSDAPADVRRYGMEACVDDLLAIQDHLGIRRCAVVGYSMGGRVAMRVALQAPERLWALVLESASPGIADPADRRARVRQDAKLAAQIRKDGVAAFADYWQSTVPVRQPIAVAGIDPAGTAKINACNIPRTVLPIVCRVSAPVMQEPVLERLRGLHVPVLLLAGALDDKYCGLANDMAALLPCSRVRIVPDAGHAVHLEQPAAFDDAVRGFLQAQAPSPTARESLS